MKGYIAFEDGAVFEGTSFGAAGESLGEVVFNTAMTGYQEILTDPSYSSQIVTMTYPLIGNYGINETDIESSRIQVAGFLVKEACKYPSNYTSCGSLGEYCEKANIIGIEGLDTRAITRKIRLAGAMNAAMYAGENKINTDDLVDKAKAWDGLQDKDLVKNVTCTEAYRWNDRTGSQQPSGKTPYSIVAFDFGIKYSILRILESLGCRITVVPASTSARDVLAMNPDGVFLSNGPGDPGGVPYAVETIKALIGKLPVFGICLGHQLIALALGGTRYKLKFGHHGANHPVRYMKNGEIEITSQNHNYCIDSDTLKSTGATMTHLNLNDTTCEGLEVPESEVFSVQYHPEASPGPHDSGYLFEQFIDTIEKR
ncbi:MAG: glutamine-hydrolyzing carbamoyl-phosphate synthase small subunit [Chitinivibrionales bacterium]|nr:glutamine-hydrolyzing carbamoyl-phosphate synthase small subunit [Chitinivibrionales bacterium]